MSIRMLALWGVILSFGLLSFVALMEVGYLGLLEPHFRSWGAAQVLVDLVILAVLSCVWMVGDARKRGLKAWPFVLLTVAAGSFGPLFYLVFREWKRV